MRLWSFCCHGAAACQLVLFWIMRYNQNCEYCGTALPQLLFCHLISLLELLLICIPLHLNDSCRQALTHHTRGSCNWHSYSCSHVGHHARGNCMAPGSPAAVNGPCYPKNAEADVCPPAVIEKVPSLLWNWPITALCAVQHTLMCFYRTGNMRLYSCGPRASSISLHLECRKGEVGVKEMISLKILQSNGRVPGCLCPGSQQSHLKIT